MSIPTGDPAFWINYVIKQYNTYFQKQMKRPYQYNVARQGDYFPFIPSSDAAWVIDRLTRVQMHQDGMKLKLIDCGCGIGNVMLLAKSIGYYVYGIEYDLESSKIAESLTDSKVVCGDILTFDGYADFDVIYYYTPIRDVDKMRKFLEKIINDMKVGGIIVSYSEIDNSQIGESLEELSDIPGVYMKVK